MSIVLTTKARTAELVYSGDPSVSLTPDSLAKRTERWRRQQVAIALASLPSEATEDERRVAESAAVERAGEAPFPRVWVPVDECSSYAGATIATVRPLSWMEDQEAQGLAPAEQIRRVLELALVDFDGDVGKKKAFLADSPATLVSPLYRAVNELTWGS